MWTWILIVVCLSGMFVAWAICKAGAQADERMREVFEKQAREKKNHENSH